jgi:serine/threonine protein kinase
LIKGEWSIPFNVEISIQGINFLNHLLKFDPDERLSIDQLVSHPYLDLRKDQLKYINSI